MTLKDLLQKENIDHITIMVRLLFPENLQKEFGGEDTLFGYCGYNGTDELISMDGDNYSINMDVVKYEYMKHDDEKMLVVWGKW